MQGQAPEKKRFRGNKKMAWSFFVTMAVLSGVRIAIPEEIFLSSPDILRSAVEVLPAFLCAVFLLNDALPQHRFRGSSYGLMLALLAPMVVLYDYAYQLFRQVFPNFNQWVDVWSLAAIPLHSIAPLLLDLIAMLSFIVLWRAAFMGGTAFRVRWRKLLNPLFWLVAILLHLLRTYLILLVRAQAASGYDVQLIFGSPAITAPWYRLDPFLNLVGQYAVEPVKTFALGAMLYWAMRMLRVSYLLGMPQDPPAAPQVREAVPPAYLQGPRPPTSRPVLGRRDEKNG